MSSVKDEITGQTIANEIMLERSVHHGSFFLVEGETDASLFSGFVVSHECSIVVCAGWENLFGAINTLSGMGIEDALGFSDRDYFGEKGYPEYNGNIVFTDENDLETQMIRSQALNKLLEEFGDVDQVAAEVNESGMTPPELILKWAQAPCALRFLSSKHEWHLKFDGMKYRFTDANSPDCCISKTVQHVLGRSQNNGAPNQASIETSVRACIAAHNDLWIANGHDCVAVLGRALRRRFGKTNRFNSPDGYDYLGKILRIAYEYSFFQETRGYNEIRRWEQATHKTVLKAA